MPRAPRRCVKQGCDEYVPCPKHRRKDDPGRPSRQARGHGGSAYDNADKDPAFIAATHCPTCGKPFGPGRPKTKGHLERPARYGGSKIVAQCGGCNYGWRRKAKT